MTSAHRLPGHDELVFTICDEKGWSWPKVILSYLPETVMSTVKVESCETGT